MRGISTIITSPIRKSQKCNSTSRRCYIEHLPNHVLSHILSRLPLKDAVRTCVLSEDWEFKWTSIYNVDIDAKNFSLESKKENTFINILQVLVLHFEKLSNFRLSCSCRRSDGLSRIVSVISAILRRNIKSLEIEIRENEDFFLPRSLLNCASLQELKMLFGRSCSFRVPVNNCFPNLKSLSLENVKFQNESSITDTLLFTFPVLNKLDIRYCKWLKVKLVEIDAPFLSDFTSITSDVPDDENEFDYSIKLIRAKIDKFYSGGGYSDHIIMFGSTAASANLEYIFSISLTPEECGLQVRKQLRELSDSKYLCIYDSLQAIAKTKLGLPLLTFKDLNELELHYGFDPEGLLELLQAAPCLKFLSIPMYHEEEDEDEYYDYDSVEPLPVCIVNHLEKVSLEYIGVSKPAFLLEKFLLKNGAHLKNVVISGASKRKLKKTSKKLSTFPKASSLLIIDY